MNYLALLNIVTVVGVVTGTLQCFFGYRLFKVTVTFVGFLIGFLTVFGLSVNAVGVGYGILLGILTGVAIAVIFHFLSLILIFFIGAAGGFSLGLLAGSVIIGGDGTAILVVSSIAGIALGVVALFLRKVIIIISTSFMGAGLVVLCIARFVEDPSHVDVLDFIRDIATIFYNPILGEGSLNIPVLVSWILMGILGIVVQYLVGEKKRGSK